MKCQAQDINSHIDDIKKVKSYFASSPSIFASFSESSVLSIYENVLEALKSLSLDWFHTDISQEEEYLFIYGKKRDVIIFFNLFFENNDVDAMVVVSTPKSKHIIEDDVENSIQKLFQIFQEL